MQSPTIHAVTLARHPDSQGDAVRNVSARVGRTPGGTLAITYSIEGDIAKVRMPAAKAPQFAERLWQHTCCECFVALKDAPGYHEYNFAPSGEWAAYAFGKYRDGAPLADEALNPRIAVRKAAGRLELDAALALDRLSSHHPRATLALALSAVIEEEDGVISYWALKHPAGKPDFHHRDSFALELE